MFGCSYRHQYHGHHSLYQPQDWHQLHYLTNNPNNSTDILESKSDMEVMWSQVMPESICLCRWPIYDHKEHLIQVAVLNLANALDNPVVLELILHTHTMPQQAQHSIATRITTMT
jgi:hypothetical protein